MQDTTITTVGRVDTAATGLAANPVIIVTQRSNLEQLVVAIIAAHLLNFATVFKIARLEFNAFTTMLGGQAVVSIATVFKAELLVGLGAASHAIPLLYLRAVSGTRPAYIHAFALNL